MLPPSAVVSPNLPNLNRGSALETQYVSWSDTMLHVKCTTNFDRLTSMVEKLNQPSGFLTCLPVKL